MLPLIRLDRRSTEGRRSFRTSQETDEDVEEGSAPTCQHSANVAPAQFSVSLEPPLSSEGRLYCARRDGGGARRNAISR